MRVAYHAGFKASGEGEYPEKDLTEALNKRFDSVYNMNIIAPKVNT